ncbi:hypothetical protein M0R72_11025 [Candidatus Pacearchaeota archaeon]|jgi:hypothetical protein|nr:hypothetical protein [Candidatus Pacearchaeota archaeon]
MTDTTFDDSYIETDAELETMIGSDPRTAAVALKALAAASQAWYCQEATRRIDALSLRGQKWDMTSSNGVAVQTLEFPRLIDGAGVGNGIDYDLIPEVPDMVKRACMEEAIALYQVGTSGGLKDLQEQGVSSMSIGGKLSYSFVSGAGGQGLQSAAAKRYLRKYLGAATR